MSGKKDNNQRIIKNTMMLYIRMFVSIIVSLYTSRVVLQVLGVDDYGIFGVVGGVVAMFSFLNSAMSGATSRFLTFEMGKEQSCTNQIIESEKQKSPISTLQKTFSSAIIIHLGIAFIIFILSITIGLWFLNNKLVIPGERMYAAYWVYVCSILGMFVNVTIVPYNAAIIAHEKMDIYAYVELLNVFLKLGIVYLLFIGNIDKLILYSILMLMVNVVVAMTYRVYCLKNYKETYFHWIIDKQIIKSMTSFSLYNLFGNMGWVVNAQGTNFIINMFFGVAFNAGASVATTVSGVVNGFASNVMTAFRPPITKAYAQEDYKEFENLLNWSIKIILIIYSLIAIPVCLTTDRLLQLWLVEVPPYAEIFCQLMLISLYWEIFKQLIVMGIHACGRVRAVSLMSGIMYCINPVIIYICFKMGLSASFAYISAIFMHLTVGMIDVCIMQHEIKFISIRSYLFSLLLVTFAVLVTFGICFVIPKLPLGNVMFSIFSDSVLAASILGIVSYVVVLNTAQRNRLHSLVKSKIGSKGF